MLDETKADESLERVIEMAEDWILKARNNDELESACERYCNLTKVYNDRLKVQNERYVSEAKMALEAEKFDHDKEVQEIISEEERKARNKEFIFRAAVDALKLGYIGYGYTIQTLQMHNNIIETDPISKGMTRNLFNRLGDFIKG